MSKKDILNFMDSDEVSEIDGLKLTKSQSYAHIVPERERDLRKTSSYSKISLLAPDFANKNAKSMRSLSQVFSETNDLKKAKIFHMEVMIHRNVKNGDNYEGKHVKKIY
jgi:hypothetical protein